MFTQVLAKSPRKRAAERLYRQAERQARAEVFYARMGVPDTVAGRFELLTLHVILLIDRLKAERSAVDDRQALFDAYLSNLDGALREMGVGDLSVGKRMRKLGEAFYGRAKAYEDAFAALPDLAALEEVVGRTALAGAGEDPVRDLATYVARCRASLSDRATEDILSAAPAWAIP